MVIIVLLGQIRNKRMVTKGKILTHNYAEARNMLVDLKTTSQTHAGTLQSGQQKDLYNEFAGDIDHVILHLDNLINNGFDQHQYECVLKFFDFRKGIDQ